MKCEKCEKNITGRQWHEMRDDEGYVIARYCSAECAMKDNGIIKARDALCTVCGKSCGDDPYTDEGGDLYCSQECALSANDVKLER